MSAFIGNLRVQVALTGIVSVLRRDNYGHIDEIKVRHKISDDAAMAQGQPSMQIKGAASLCQRLPVCSHNRSSTGPKPI